MKCFQNILVTFMTFGSHQGLEFLSKTLLFLSLFLTWGISSGTRPIHDKLRILQSPAVFWLRSQCKCMIFRLFSVLFQVISEIFESWNHLKLITFQSKITADFICKIQCSFVYKLYYFITAYFDIFYFQVWY